MQSCQFRALSHDGSNACLCGRRQSFGRIRQGAQIANPGCDGQRRHIANQIGGPLRLDVVAKQIFVCSPGRVSQRWQVFAAIECAEYTEEGANFDTLGLPVLKDNLLFDYFPHRGFGRTIGWVKREALLLALPVKVFAEANLQAKPLARDTRRMLPF